MQTTDLHSRYESVLSEGLIKFIEINLYKSCKNKIYRKKTSFYKGQHEFLIWDISSLGCLDYPCDGSRLRRVLLA